MGIVTCNDILYAMDDAMTWNNRLKHVFVDHTKAGTDKSIIIAAYYDNDTIGMCNNAVTNNKHISRG